MSKISSKNISEYKEDGATLIPGLFSDWVPTIKKGIKYNLKHPGEYAAENTKINQNGRFFDDYCNWERITEFKEIISCPEIIKAAATLMQSSKVQFFHDHVLFKSAGSETATPWHQDEPYYFTKGDQTVSFWIPVDPVKEASLRVIAGSHKWKKSVLPTKWLTGKDFYDASTEYIPAPNPDKTPNKYNILEWDMNPGDAIAFNFKSVHGARENRSNIQRRVLSLRYVGDDVRYTQRKGETSPPFPGHNMNDGEKLRADWFPIFEL